MDTPGGLDASTRDIIKAILNSPSRSPTFNVAAGSRATSAGTYHSVCQPRRGGRPATNVAPRRRLDHRRHACSGSKPPLEPEEGRRKQKDGGDADAEEEGSDAGRDDSVGDAMTKKVVNGSVAYIRSLPTSAATAMPTGPSLRCARRTASPAKALELGVIDFMADNVGGLLEKADGLVVEVNARSRTGHGRRGDRAVGRTGATSCWA
jgi:membrane-bound serine protease (ClpP class)